MSKLYLITNDKGRSIAYQKAIEALKRCTKPIRTYEVRRKTKSSRVERFCFSFWGNKKFAERETIFGRQNLGNRSNQQFGETFGFSIARRRDDAFVRLDENRREFRFVFIFNFSFTFLWRLGRRHWNDETMVRSRLPDSRRFKKQSSFNSNATNRSEILWRFQFSHSERRSDQNRTNCSFKIVANIFKKQVFLFRLEKKPNKFFQVWSSKLVEVIDV